MANDLGALSGFFVHFAIAGFVVYAAIVACAVLFVRQGEMPLGFFEMYRYALRSFFWYSLLVAVLCLVIFLLYFFGVLRLGAGTPPGLFALLHDLGVRRGGGAIISGTFILGTLIAVLVPMVPHAITQSAISRDFKRRMLAAAARNLSVGQALDIVSLRPGRSGFGPDLAKKLVAVTAESMVWVADTYTKTEDVPRRFSVDSFNQDRMKFTNGSLIFEFWETGLIFHGEIEKQGRREPYWQLEVTENIFDGICVRVSGAFAKRQAPRLIVTGSSNEDSAASPVRRRRPTSLIAGIFEEFLHNSTLLRSHHYTLSDFQEHVRCDTALKGLDENVRFIGINGRDLFLFIHTGLVGNLFEFHVTEKVTDSIRLFEQDLAFIQRHIQAIDELLPALEELLAKEV
ncbi:MAG: hypothetical protein GKS01_04835 [Alphaproteobacteria bacterium]|nr:hypothetical protein [Alphaproteobacteria bacterium]